MPPPAWPPPARGASSPDVGPLERRRPRVVLAVIVAVVSVVGTVGAAPAHPSLRPLDGGAVLLALVPPAAIAALLVRWPRTAALAVAYLARDTSGAPSSAAPWCCSPGPDPLAILGERYARGGIGEAQYRARLAVLRPDAGR